MTATGRPPGPRATATGGSWLRFRPPRYGFGGGPIGQLPEPEGDVLARATVDSAYGAGIRFFATAPRHGLGAAELVVDGRLQYDYSADGVLRSLAESLDRFALEAVDLVVVDEHEACWEKVYPVLRELRDQGAIKAFGVVTSRPDEVAPLVRETDLDAVLLSGRYTLLDQSAAPLVHLCRERGVAVIAGGVFGSGLLSGQADASAGQDLLIRSRRIAAVCERYAVSLPQAALAFPLRHPGVTSILVGAASPAEIRADAALVRQPVPPDLWRELTDQGLLSTE
ncbi:aldo/keto reductase [Kribbella deserti]|uniref:Aldo/keto reductase n=1 Tax=Kribbella deserti TaxID=1926257 RepID=A0ABV6QH37_9ACTN